MFRTQYKDCTWEFSYHVILYGLGLVLNKFWFIASRGSPLWPHSEREFKTLKLRFWLLCWILRLSRISLSRLYGIPLEIGLVTKVQFWSGWSFTGNVSNSFLSCLSLPSLNMKDLFWKINQSKVVLHSTQGLCLGRKSLIFFFCFLIDAYTFHHQEHIFLQ